MKKELTEYGALFRALGDPHRLQILELLQSREMNGTELLEKVDVVQSTLSHHMKTLCEAGLVLTRKEGKKTYYGAAAGALREGARMLEALAGGASKGLCGRHGKNPGRGSRGRNLCPGRRGSCR